MKNTNHIESLWKEHLATPFPDRCRGEEAGGVDLVMLDADIAGCVSTYIGNNGSLDAHRFQILQDLQLDAQRVVGLLEDSSEQEYYTRLGRLAHLVLAECTG